MKFWTIALAVAALCAGTAPVSQATTLYWDGTTGVNLNDATQWSTSSSATTPNPSSAPVAGDTAVFNISTVNGNETINVTANFTVDGLIFNNTGTTLFSQTANRVFTIGSSGIVMNAGAGAVTLGQSTNSLGVTVGATQTWQNDSGGLLNIRNAMSNGAGLTDTLTLSGSGAGGFNFSNAINEGAGSSMTIVVDITGSGVASFSSTASSYTGGTTIKRGSVTIAGGASLGTGAILLGDTTGTGNATLTLNTTGTINNNITTQSGMSGIVTISSNNTTPIIAGTLTLNRDTTFSGTGTTTVVNNIAGAGNLIMSGGGTLALGNGGTTGGLNTGTAVSGTGSIAFNRSDNVTLSNNFSGAVGITQLGTGTLTIDGNFTTGTGATKISNGTLAIDFTGAPPATTADLINGSSALTVGGPTFAGALTITGKTATGNSQTFNGTTFNTALDSTITLTSGASGGTLSLTLGAVTRNAGSLVNFVADSGSSVASSTGSANTIWLSSGGIVIGTFGNDWAARAASGTGVLGGSTLAGFYTASTTTSLAGNADVASGVDTTLGGNASITSLRFNVNEARTVDLGGSTLTLTSGGLLIGSTVATAGSKISNGTIKGSTGTSKELVVVQNSAQAFEIAAVIADVSAATAFSKHGSGTLILSNNNTWTGQTYIAAGTLQIGNGGTSGSIGGTATVTDNGALVVNRSDALSISNVINGTGSVLVTGGGTTTFSGASGYTGGLTVKNGTVQGATSSTAFGPGTITLGDTSGSNNVSLIQTTTSLTVANNIVLAAGNTGTVTIGNTTAGIAATTFSGSISGNHALTLANNGSGVFALTLSGAVNNGGAISATGTSTGVTTLSGNIGSAVTGITQNSSGILTLSGTNSAFGGPVNLTAGTLRVNSATALGGNGSATGTGGALTIGAGTALENTTGSPLTLTTVNAVNINGNFTYSGANSLAFTTGDVTLGAANITLTDSAAGSFVSGGAVSGTTNLVLTAGSTGGLTFSGSVGLTGSIASNGAGSGTLTLSGGVASSVTTITNTSAGGLTLSGAGKSVLNNGDITLSASGSSTSSLSATTINPNGQIINGGTTTGTTTISGAVGSNVTAIIQNNPNNTLAFSSGTAGQIGSVGGYTGGIWIKAGSATVATSAAGNVNPISGAGTITLGDTSGSANARFASLNGASAPNVNNAFLIKEGSTGDKILEYNSTSGGPTFSGSLTFEDNPNLNVAMNVILRKLGAGGGSFVYSGPISGNGTLTLENVASSTLQISGTNTNFSGTANFNLGATGVTASAALNANVAVNITSGATMSYSAGGTLSIAGLTGAGTASMATGATRTIALAGASGSYSFTGAISNGTNAGNVTKTAGSTQTLGGASTYTGTTTISGGTLLVTGTHTGAGAYSVNSGTLGGNGTISTAAATGATVAAGGKLAPGAAIPGTLTFNFGTTGTLNMSAGVTATNSQSLLFDLDTVGGSDMLAVTNGNVATAVNIGTGVLEFDDFAFTLTGNVLNGNVYTLIDSNAAITGTLGANLSGNLPDPWLVGTLSLANSGQDLVLTVTPEPSSVALLSIGGLALLRRRRRAA